MPMRIQTLGGTTSTSLIWLHASSIDVSDGGYEIQQVPFVRSGLLDGPVFGDYLGVDQLEP